MAEAVKVAVRVRPFNTREKDRNASVIIGMNGKITTIKDPANPGTDPRQFTFDYSYWSHDGFKTPSNPDGYLVPDNPKYADQRKVFDDLGRGVLDNAWQGYNCSLFAYGQTGSGKSYSMVGYGENKGIVPISCEELFKGIEDKRKSAKQGEEYQVTVSMLEIYNEQVRDLLNPKSAQKGGLKVRQHPSKGFYVEQLVSAPVSSYGDIDGKVMEGTRNRTVASTNMNATSSRAHTIISITFTQKTPNEAGQSMTKSSNINLVDLAGSERAESTGATGDRLKEGAAINKSLSVLGNVIKALADQSTGKRGVLVPFRDSVLTMLLKNALGGNSKTVMIAALSPADINYEETLSTLRFADRAKAIKTKATVNESPTDKLIRELREENQKLMDMLKKGGTLQATEEEDAADSGQMEEIMKKNQDEMEAMQRSWEQRLEEERMKNESALVAQQNKEQDKKVTPHFWNLNEDPSLTGMVVHLARTGTSRVGNKTAQPQPEIMLQGLSIQKEHATVLNKDMKVTIQPIGQANVLVNGQPVCDETLLHHNDRVMFGSNHLYVFHHPQDYAKSGAKNGDAPAPLPTYDTAQQEIAEKSGLVQQSGGSKEDLLLQEDLVHIMPMVNEGNAMSEELDKKVKFSIDLVSPQARGLKEGRTEVFVTMKDLDTGNEFMWDRNKFINRKYLMQEMYQNYVEGNEWDVPQEKDPFWEPPDSEVMIGSCHVYLQSLCYQIETKENLDITDFKGQARGCLSVEILPCDNKWKDLGDDDFVDNPNELVGECLNLKLQIKGLNGLPAKYEKSFCRYKFYLDESCTETDEVKGMNPQYKHEKKIACNPVTKQLVEYLENSPVVVEVWGRQKNEKGGGKPGEKKGAANTKDLVSQEKTISQAAKNDDLKYKHSVELNVLKKRAERLQTKLDKIQALVDKANKKKQDTLSVKEVSSILNGTSNRFKATAGVVAMTKASRQENLGDSTSKACTVL